MLDITHCPFVSGDNIDLTILVVMIFQLRAQGNGMDYVCQQLITQPFNITDSSTEAVVDCETYQGLVMKSDTSEATSALSSSSSWNLEQALNDVGFHFHFMGTHCKVVLSY